MAGLAHATIDETVDGWDVKGHEGVYIRVKTQENPKKVTVIVSPIPDEPVAQPLAVTLGTSESVSA